MFPLFVEALVFLDFYKNNIFADLTDAFPGNDVFALPSEEAAETSGARDNQRSQPACFTVKFHINGAAKAFAGAYINNFFLF